MDERTWQDVMIDHFGTDWLKDKYTVIDMDKLAQTIIKLETENKILREGLEFYATDGFANERPQVPYWRIFYRAKESLKKADEVRK
jgi:hypothetical protein